MDVDITQISFYIHTKNRDAVLAILGKLGIGNIGVKRFPESPTFAKYASILKNISSTHCVNCDHVKESHEEENGKINCYGLIDNSQCGCIRFIPMKS